MLRFKSILQPVLGAVFAAGLAALATVGASAQTLTGAGSTFINPIMTHWVADYQKEMGASINYQPVGSGAGINNLTNRTVDFAGSDAPMNATELAHAGAPVIHLPAVIGAVPVVYNIGGVQSGMKFTGGLLADIFLGNVKYWDDAAITKINPGVNLPHERIFIVHRSDGSGTTNIFTDYLSKVSGEWKNRVGAGKSVNWPAGLGAKGSAGVAALLKTHENSIGYVELAYAIDNHIPYGVVQNQKGRFVAPSAESAAAAAENFPVPSDLRVFITNTAQADGYPITGFSWLIVYKNPANNKAADLKRFLGWVLTKGQSYTGALNYASVPAGIRSREQALIASIH